MRSERCYHSTRPTSSMSGSTRNKATIRTPCWTLTSSCRAWTAKWTDPVCGSLLVSSRAPSLTEERSLQMCCSAKKHVWKIFLSSSWTFSRKRSSRQCQAPWAATTRRNDLTSAKEFHIRWTAASSSSSTWTKSLHLDRLSSSGVCIASMQTKRARLTST